MLNPADIAPERVRPLLRMEFEQLVASGAFDNERVELLDGLLVTMTPQDAAHAYTVQLRHDYSVRSAIAGSIRVARRVGK